MPSTTQDVTSGPGSPFTVCIFSVRKDAGLLWKITPTSNEGINHQLRVMRTGRGEGRAQGRRDAQPPLYKKTKEVTRKLQLLIQYERFCIHSQQQRCWQRLSRCDAAHRALTRRLPAAASPSAFGEPAHPSPAHSLLHSSLPQLEIFSVGFTCQPNPQSQGEKNNVLEALKDWAWLF